MPIVTDIKPQKNGKRVNVYLDGKFAFGIDLVNLVSEKVKVGSEFSEAEIETIVKKAELQKVGDKLVEYSTLRPRSKKEISDYLKRKKVPEFLHSDLLARLYRIGVVDDAEFAKWWIGQRLEFKTKSKRELINELRVKGIEGAIIEQVVDNFQIDDSKSAKKIIEKYSYRWAKIGREERKRKIISLLSRKGFSWDVIEKIASLE